MSIVIKVIVVALLVFCSQCIGLKGVVHRVYSDGDVYVECINQDK